ncbi:MAG: peptidoglycan DD-metalloendopeptidase family protein [Chloroflexota bacterium]|nr:peptidoglycan DD-metalloendopeptidase family protein [Chloroflexota bacterium]
MNSVIVRPVLIALLLLFIPSSAYADDPPGPPTGGDQPGAQSTTTVTLVPVEGKRYTLYISVRLTSPGTNGDPRRPKPQPPKRPGPPPGDPKLPRTTYYTLTVDGELQYCVRREEEKRPGHLWGYWYQLCTVSVTGSPEWEAEVAKHPNERPYLLSTNIPLQIYYTPCGGDPPICAHVIAYSEIVWVPKRYESRHIDVRGDPITATDAAEAAESVLANLPMPEIRLTANPDLGLVNVPAWFWAERYNGQTLSHTENVFLTAPGAPAPGDCPPVPPIQNMRTNLTLPSGVPEIIGAVFKRGVPRTIWGWGYSDMDGHQPYLGYSHFHTGIDFPAPEGTPLYAPAAGVARQEVWRNGTNVVRLLLPSGHTYNFLHLSHMVASGPVDAGDLIGYVGDTGYSFQPHLHIEMMPPGVATGEWVPPEHWSCLGGGAGLSVTVTVHMRGTTYLWDFGDGSAATGSLGRPYPAQSDVTHTYQYSSAGHKDGFPTRLTVQYGGEYIVDNGPPQALPLIEVTYEGGYRVQEAQSVLTDR